MQNLVFVLMLGLFLPSCEKKDPKPELRDAIYQDMIAQKAAADKLIKDTDSKIEELRKSAAEARPQTGMRQRAERQKFEMEKLKSKLSQQVVYWRLRTFERLKYVRTKASNQKDEYVADPSEWNTYAAEKKLRSAKNAWDLRARFKETGFEYNPILMGEMPSEESKKETPAPGGGGH